jgi:endonuclease-3
MSASKTKTAPAAIGEKRPFDIDGAIKRIRTAVQPFRKAAMFELADDGYDSLFEQLTACVISIRTRDEETVEIARRLFAEARTPEEIASLPLKRIDDLITPSTFHEAKAVTIRDIARRTVEEFGGALPCDDQTLQTFSGVGPKCSHLALGVACGQPLISVDIHVHRVTNRWGIVSTSTPEQTMVALGRRLPEKYRVEINQLLVPFGKHICTGIRPKCSTCPVLDMCNQVGVTSYR